MADPSPEKDQDPLIGRVINDRFRIVSPIARGGMGRVYRATQEPLGREVALKVLDPRYHGEEDPDFQARFFLEASTAAKLTHPNTVTVFDYGKTNDDVYFIVMELVDGPTLATSVKTHGALEPLHSIHIAIQIARSVREAHQLNVIHRDLKPANVLLTRHADEESFVKVLDFGLVKDLKEDQELTQQGLFMGSPKYMSPEQIQGGDVDSRTDVYSLGVILYFMLCGRVPFEGSTQVQTLMAHVKEDVPPMVRADGVGIPEELQQVVHKCLRKDPVERFGSMNDLILALKQVGSVLGVPMGMSGSVSMSGEFDASGIRASAMATPSFGLSSYPPPPISVAGGSVPPGSISPASLTSITTTATPSRSKGWLVLGAAVLLIGGGLAYVLSTSGAPEPAEPTPTTTTTMAAAPTEPETSDPAVRTCEVTIRSTPPGAEVFVEERSYGRTPARVEWVGDAAEVGREVTFRFELDGYRPMSVTRTVLNDALDVRAELQADERATVMRPVMRPGMRPSMRPGMRPTMRPTMESTMDIDVANPDYRDNPY